MAKINNSPRKTRVQNRAKIEGHTLSKKGAIKDSFWSGWVGEFMKERKGRNGKT